jgi:RNA polymerase sigma factor (sigma-70 family)
MTGAESVVDLDHARVVEAYDAVRQFANVVADSDIDPDDLVHEAMVRMLSRGSLSEVRDVVAYLRRAVLNVAANHRRSQGRRRNAIERLRARRSDDGTPGAELPSDLSELLRLAPLDRAVLFLFVVEGRPHREVAELVDLSEVAVRARLSRALRRLRVELEEDSHGDDR